MKNIKDDEKKYFKIAAIPLEKNERTSKKGNKYAYVQFSDYSGNFEAIMFSDILNASSELIDQHELLILDIEAIKSTGNLNLRIQGLSLLRHFLSKIYKKINLFVDDKVDISFVKKYLSKYTKNDGSEVTLRMKLHKQLVDIKLPGKFDYFALLNNKINGINFLN